MARFFVYSGETLVGHSLLERGDPPMGVAFGMFEPTEGYAQIQHICATNHSDQSALGLSVKTEAGVAIACAAVGILDYSAEVESSEIEVNVLGIPYPLYGDLFPHHVVAYERQFG